MERKKLRQLIQDIKIIKKSGKLSGHTGPRGATPDRR